MKDNQEFTPKYWVIHDKNSDDIFQDTMSKCASHAWDKYEGLHLGIDGVNAEVNRDLECILVSIERVEGF